MCNNKIDKIFWALLSKVGKFLIYTSRLLLIAFEIQRARTDERTNTVTYALRKQILGKELIILYNFYS